MTIATETAPDSTQAPIALGVLGMGRAFTLMLPTFAQDPRVRLVAAFDPRASAQQLFVQEFSGVAHESAQGVCADPNVEWVYIASPHQMHAEHVELAARYGKHVLVEKPMALSLSDCTRMMEATNAAGTHLIVGHSHSFNAPVLLAKRIIERQTYGVVRMIHAMNFTDFLFRPRRPEELDTSRGGGVVFSQAAHQIDVVRLLGGGQVASVFARTGKWDPTRPTEGAYTALLNFESGVVANVTYNGYGFYDSDVLMGQVGELAKPKPAGAHQATRQRLEAAVDEQQEALLKAERNFGGAHYVPEPPLPPQASQHFGPVIVSCDRADLRLTPMGVEVYDAQGVRLEPAGPPLIPRQEVIDELWAVARQGAAPVHGGAWSRATLEVCLAILESGQQNARAGRAYITLHHQMEAPLLHEAR
jgi:phthalate 4,5-cis-dihydrodiol dehydrogenase